jgi:hypothetical protein
LGERAGANTILMPHQKHHECRHAVCPIRR